MSEPTVPSRGKPDWKASEDDSACRIDPLLLDLLVCPLTKGRLVFDRAANELVSEGAHLAYPIRDGIPIMLVSEARQIEK